MSSSDTITNSTRIHPDVHAARLAASKGQLVALCDPAVEEAARPGLEEGRKDPSVSWLAILEGLVPRADTDVLFLDCTGNAARSDRLAELASASGRTFHSSLTEPFNIWRPDAKALRDRLHTIAGLDVPRTDRAFRKVAEEILQEVCEDPLLGPPRSSKKLIERLAPEQLSVLRGQIVNNELRRDDLPLADMGHWHIAGARLRALMADFFDGPGSKLDGPWAFEDIEVGYLGFASDELQERWRLGRLLVLCLTQYLETQYRMSRPLVVFFDAIPQDITSFRMKPLIEAAHSFGAGMVFLPETYRDLGRYTAISYPSIGLGEIGLD